MYFSFLKAFNADAAELNAARDLVEKAGELLWEGGLLNARIPSWGGDEIAREFEQALKGKRDISVVRWPDDYAQTLYYTRQDLMRAITRKEPELRRLREWAEKISEAVSSPDFESGVAYHDEVSPAEVQQLRLLPALAKRILVSLDVLLKRMARASETSSLDKVPAAAEAADVEILYHASVHARELAATGFSLSMPASDTGAGLGGSQSIGGGRKGVSFTEDQYVAKEIARVFKEVAMIAQGDVAWGQVLEWIRRSGHEKQMLDWYANNHDPRRTSRGINPPPRDPEEPHSPEEVMGLYLSYLNFADRYDPKFFGIGPKGLVQRFRSLNPKDIGYIVAKVDMTNPDITYGHGEREVRIPPEAVLSVEKFIG